MSEEKYGEEGNTKNCFMKPNDIQQAESIKLKEMQLQCPIPKLDFDTINLGHGSGGTLTSQLLNNGVFKLLENDLLNKKHDGAIFNLHGKVAMSTDTFVVTPIFLKVAISAILQLTEQ